MRISDWSSDVCSSDLGGRLAERKEDIARLFGDDDLDVVVAAVDAAASNSDWIAEARSALRRASPTSLRATWRRVVEGRGRSVERILADDHRMAVRIVGGHDFAEGVRAILVEKDMRSEERREGKGWVSTFRSRCSPYP